MEFIYRFFRRIKFSYKISSILSDWKGFLMLDVSAPVLQMCCFSLVGYYVYGADNIAKWMIGNAILISSFGAIYRVGLQLIREKSNGTLSLLVATRTRLSEIFFTSAVSSMLTSFISVIIGVILMSIILNISWDFIKIVSFISVLIVAIFTSVCFGFLFSCFILISTEVQLLVNTAEKILLIFTGANFSITQLPIFLQKFSYCLPLTRSIEASQKIVQGDSIFNNIHLIRMEFILGIIFLFLGTLMLRYMESLAIKKGILDML